MEVQYATGDTLVLVDASCPCAGFWHRDRLVICYLYRSQPMQCLQELQILQALRERGGNMRSVQAARVTAVTLLIWSSFGQAQTLAPAQAKTHEGENATVCGKVASEKTATSSKGQPTFINLDSAYPNQIFTVLVWGDDRKNVGELPQIGLRVCASGKIQDYRGVPEIVVRSSGQLSR
jgi:hypothetical protein